VGSSPLAVGLVLWSDGEQGPVRRRGRSPGGRARDAVAPSNELPAKDAAGPVPGKQLSGQLDAFVNFKP